jgi:sugar phosphate isomerase/epimerase
MEVRNIGLDLSASENTFSLKEQERILASRVEAGWKLIEFPIEGLNILINGELRSGPLGNVVAMLRSFHISYTVHGHMRVNLAFDERRDLVNSIMEAQIEFCRRIGADRLVIHSGLEALTAARMGVLRRLPDENELVEGARQEVSALRRLAPLSADAGVLICVENGDPHLWEYNVLAQFGLGEESLPKYHGRLLVDNVVRQLEAVDHPSVGMCLDFGHLYLASRALGFNYLEAIVEAAPWVRHLHLSDNYGNLDRGENSGYNRWAFGEADMHMPPGWGEIPYPQVFDPLKDFSGDMILELDIAFQDHFAEARQQVAGWVGSGTDKIVLGS